MKLSVVIITLNAEDVIERCITSIDRIADEILVVDSQSKDLTVRIASDLGAKVIEHEFSDFVSQRNFAVTQAKYDWVLCLDADEVLSMELERNIRVALIVTEFECYELTVQNNYCGRWMRFSSLHAPRQLRFFDRTKGKWRGRLIDERWRPFQSKLPVGRLDGPIYHFPILSWESYRLQITRRADMMAEANFQSGKSYSLFLLMWLPTFHFIKHFFFKLGCLDLLEGYRAAKMCALQKYLIIKKTRSFPSNCGQ